MIKNLLLLGGQWVYGIPQNTKHWEELPDTILFARQVTKANNYILTKVIPNINEPDKPSHIIIPFKPKEVAKFLNLKEFNDKTYKLDLYWKRDEHNVVRCMKIADGHRNDYGRRWIYNLIGQYFKLTKKYNKDIPYEDLLWNFQHQVELHFEDGTNCNCYENLVKFLKSLYEKYKDKPYEDCEKNMQGKIHLYRLMSYTIDLCLSIRNQLEYDPDKRILTCLNRKELLILLKSKNMSESTFKRRVEYWGFELQYKERSKHKEHKNKGITKINLSKYEIDENNVILIPKCDITPYLKNFLSKNKLKYKGIKQ